MSDHEFDLELKQRANTDADPVPVGFQDRLQAAVEKLPERGAKRTRFRVLRPALAAAVMIFVLSGTVLAAGTAAGFDFVTFFGGTKTDRFIFIREDGTKVTEEWAVVYEAADSGLIYFPVEDLSEAVREAASAENGVHLDLPTWESVEEFIGLDIANSRTLEQRAIRKDFQIRRGNGPSETYQHMVSLWGEEPDSIEIRARYQLDGIPINLMVYIRTDAVPQEYQDGRLLTQFDSYGASWSREDYLTVGGLETVLIHNLTTSSVEAVFTLNGTGYLIMASGPDREQALATMKDVLDGFQ